MFFLAAGGGRLGARLLEAVLQARGHERVQEREHEHEHERGGEKGQGALTTGRVAARGKFAGSSPATHRRGAALAGTRGYDPAEVSDP